MNEQDVWRQIQLEQELRTYKNNVEFAELLEKQKKESQTIGDGPGITAEHKRQRDTLTEYHSAYNEVDNRRFDRYWDQYHAGTFQRPSPFPEKEEKVKNAELELNVLLDRYKNNVPVYFIDKLKNDYGNNIMQDIEAKWIIEKRQKDQQKSATPQLEDRTQKQIEEEKRRQEAERLYQKMLENQKMLEQGNNQSQGISMN